MLPLLTAPWALVALAALPALAALYWLRNTWREEPVSTLMLWLHHADAPMSGLRLRRLRTPLLFFLELVALLSLTAAAIGPRVDTGQGRWPLVVVLDDSFSMQAGGDDSPRRLAIAALEHEVRWGEAYPVRFIRAGQTAQALGDMIHSWTEAQQVLEHWHCRAPTTRLLEAISLGSELSGDMARILVISDHQPEHEPGEGRVQWWSFGKSRANLAFVNAARNVLGSVDRCVLEIANFSRQAQTTMLVLEGQSQESKKQQGGQEILRETLSLNPHEIRRLNYRLPGELAVLYARLGDDALPFDNQVVLLREELPPVRVQVRLKNDALRMPVEKALQATGKTAPPGNEPQLVITDDADAQPATARTWVVQIHAEKDAEPFVGPFVVDRTHPLTEGLNLGGIVWAAGPGREFGGAPIVLAGGVPLITDTEDIAGMHHIRLRLRPDLSTLLETPAWPILMCNLVQWRAAESPGLRRANVRFGELVHAIVPVGVESIIYVPPLGPSRAVPVLNQRIVLRPDEAGMHELEVGATKYRFAVNVLQPDESDLTQSVTGRWGQWSDEPATAPAIDQLAWIPMLIALGILTLHMVLAVRSGSANRG